MAGKGSRRYFRGFLLIPILAACGGRESLLSSYDARFVGTITPESGQDCRPAGPSPATLTLKRSDKTVMFAPTDGVLVLSGSLAPDGTVHAKLDLTTTDDHKPYPLVLDGMLVNQSFTGTYTTPDCRYRVALGPPKPPSRRIFAPKNILQQGFEKVGLSSSTKGS